MKRIVLLLIVFVTFFSGCGFEKVNEKVDIKYHYTAPWNKDFFDKLYKDIKIEENLDEIKGGIIPHHLLAGYLDASFFENLKQQNPSTIVILGPNHFYKGRGKIISSEYYWHTPYGDLATNNEIIDNLQNKKIVSIEESVINDEHSIYSILPFIKKSLPESQVLPFIFKGDINEEQMDNFVSSLLEVVPFDTVFVSSIDFSHYQTWSVANFHDELSIDVIKSFDFASLNKLEIDSVPSLYILLKIMEKNKTQKMVLEKHDNSAQMIGDMSADNITSYYSPYFAKGEKTEKSLTSFLLLGDKELSDDLAGEERRFLYGFDFLLAEDNSVKSEEIDYLYNNKFVFDYFDESSKVKKDFALGVILYKDKSIKFYLFPYGYKDKETVRMEYKEAQNFATDLFAKNKVKDYNIEEFSFVIKE